MSSMRTRLALAGAALVGVLALTAQAPAAVEEPAPEPQAQEEKVYAAALPERTRADLSPVTTTTAPPPPPTTTTTVPQRPATTTTAPPAPSAPVERSAPSGGNAGGNCGGWESLISAHFPGEVSKACSVMMCESRGNPTAENSSSSASGLWQFLAGTWESVTGTPAPASQYSAETQTAAAAKLRNSSGWGQWSCR